MTRSSKIKVAALVTLTVALVLEAIPGGAVLIFHDGGCVFLTRTFSYFDPIAFGYANFGPLCTAVLTCLLLLCRLVSLAHEFSRGARSAVAAFSLAALLFSLMPLLFGISYFPFHAACISVLLLLHAIVAFLDRAASPQT